MFDLLCDWFRFRPRTGADVRLLDLLRPVDDGCAGGARDAAGVGAVGVGV